MRRVAIVTGGQQGIGFAIAAELAGRGHAVAMVAEAPESAPAVADALARIAAESQDRSETTAGSRSRRRAREAVGAEAGSFRDARSDLAADEADLGEPGREARYYRHDLADVDAVRDLVDRIETDLGPVTTLVSNAGVAAPVRGDMLDLTPENFDVVLDINLRGTLFLAQAVARRMIALGDGTGHYRSLVFVTSVSAGAASPERAEYCISKAGAAMMAQLFAVRLAPHGIGVFDVRPGIIETAMTAPVKDRYTGRIADGLVPARRWGRPDDVAAAVVPLVLGAFGFATGAVIPVDGGLSIPRL